MVTFGKVLARNSGIGPGFDFLRVFLAICIVLFHSQLLTGNIGIRNTPLWFMEYGLVPMFFALSGFLVTASGMRLTLKNFLINRGLRILPALAVDIIVCAMVIGPIVTTAHFSDYVSDRKFGMYFLNIFGWIHYFLPGVFEKNHVSNMVNGALWTVPYEIICYVVTSIFIIGKFLHRPLSVLLITLTLVALGIFFESQAVLQLLPGFFRKLTLFALVSRNAQIVTAFLVGMLMFQFRDRIPYSIAIFFVSASICVGTALFFDEALITDVAPRLILLPALSYITVFLGLTAIRIPRYFKGGDYSYGIYLYHDPFLQLIIGVFPIVAITRFYGGIFAFFVGLPVVMVVAYLSWHFIEKPILGLRRRFSFVAKVRGVTGSVSDESVKIGSSDFSVGQGGRI